ncbi:hypothetical protein [Shewanella baltica]|uniref:hypothetical protein n=1 Tax=Shewanella baltica TaxID=62322 RepID=UPI00325D80E2
MASHRGNNVNECCTTDDTIILLWGNSFLAKRTAIGLVKFGIVATVTVGGMDAAVEPSGTSLWRVNWRNHDNECHLTVESLIANNSEPV